ncbi:MULTISPECIES: hypothetical protein [Desulfococcus]|uniref:Uncharacterized protein n=1 Tax=Desulfococcus multivorans DSM 2059 TaxID=1121405 RepID=S7VKE0_DESML|nr:hypothetical protein [Desulfococcus multivorans]AOY57337.1 hypothetical protein Dmul_05620 [Desulfococcus multivorans]AQU99785.1 hypothetical protein B2D07_02675 [Desulfococcus multivorans]EPR45043.1 hypothetical protein dsmv_3711 [Desulfococcus multivorans DSM 2059]SKA22285.1 hypothetical protein SAMN02745446_03358 [Desulfococcus multivorans DSM 2059]
MDEKFLEFWGNLLLNAARSKKQTDELMRWLKLGFPGITASPGSTSPGSGFEEMIAVFRKLYGLDKIPEKSEDAQKVWADALKNFQNSFQDYLAFSGVVSRKEHLALVEKYEKLKAKCSDQEETIRHLRMLLEDQKEEEEESPPIAPLQDIVRNQGELFQKMMTDFSRCFSTEKSASNPKADTKREEEEEEKNDSPDRSDPSV